MTGVDVLAGLLDGPRARGAFVLRSLLAPPWSLRIQDGAPLTVLVVVRGAASLVAGGRQVRLGPGDVAVVRGPDPYTVADDPGTPPQAVIHPGQRCTGPDGEPLTGLSDLGLRTWGNDPDGPDVLLTGTYQMRGEASARLLAALPVVVVQPVAPAERPVLDWLTREVDRVGPGQQVVLDRLLDLLLVTTVRGWLARPEADAPGWYAAHADPSLRPVLQAMEARPAHPWTVAELAGVAGLSRAALARRFTAVIGQPPLEFLTHRRLTLAADLLLEPGATLGAVARQVGYGSPFALSAAFTRVRGVTPRQHREAMAAR